jgi:hypothetical protein
VVRVEADAILVFKEDNSRGGRKKDDHGVIRWSKGSRTTRRKEQKEETTGSAYIRVHFNKNNLRFRLH